MKDLNYCIFLVIMFLSISAVSQDNMSEKIKRKTPEPGSKLSPMCKAIVKKSNPALEDDPDPLFLRFNNTMRIFSNSVYKTIDTVTNENAVPLRIYYPKTSKKLDNLPVLILMHGGAFFFGSIETYHLLANKLCQKTECIIVVPDYRLAPDNPFPTPLNDCYESLLWVKNNIDSLGGNSKDIGLIGDSAGGNLVAVSTLKSIAENGPKVDYIVLYYPSTNMAEIRYPSREYFMGSYGPHYMLSEELLRKSKQYYLNGANDSQPYVSPLLADIPIDFPPTLLITAQCDPLRDEGELFGEKLLNSGVEVERIQYESMMHGFISFYPILSKGKKAIRRTAEYVKGNYYSK